VNACQNRYKTRYARLPELFCEIETARLQGKYQQIMKQFQKYALIIMDEFLLVPATEIEQRDLLEVLEYRCGRSSPIHSRRVA
jgi:DNA replication protein DnaC